MQAKDKHRGLGSTSVAAGMPPAGRDISKQGQAGNVAQSSMLPHLLQLR